VTTAALPLGPTRWDASFAGTEPIFPPCHVDAHHNGRPRRLSAGRRRRATAATDPGNTSGPARDLNRARRRSSKPKHRRQLQAQAQSQAPESSQRADRGPGATRCDGRTQKRTQMAFQQNTTSTETLQASQRRTPRPSPATAVAVGVMLLLGSLAVVAAGRDGRMRDLAHTGSHLAAQHWNARAAGSRSRTSPPLLPAAHGAAQRRSGDPGSLRTRWGIPQRCRRAERRRPKGGIRQHSRWWRVT